MAQIQASNIRLSYGERDLLDGVTLTLDSRDRSALAGANGSGKSTLMKILAGLMVPDSGSVIATKDAAVAYLPQAGITHHGRSLAEEIEQAYHYVHSMIAQKRKVETLLADPSIDSQTSDKLIEEQHELEEAILTSGYYERAAQISLVLSGLGFATEDLERPTQEFSGGWQMRIALAKLLLQRAEFLLLDEPTNYLDLDARIWLGRFLSEYEGGVLLVSHDRTFLDETVNAVHELFLGSVRRYQGNYSRYEARRSQELEQTIRDYELQQQEIARIEEFIRRFRYKATKAKQVQSRIKQLEKMVRIEIPETMKRVAFRFPAPPHSGREMVRIRDLSKSYGERRVLRRVQATITRGERIALLGPNGAGKSTLMRILAGVDRGYEGGLDLGSGVRSAFYAQDSAEQLIEGGRSVIDEALAHANGRSDQQIRNLLGAFLFRGDDIHKAVEVLSGGERSRLSLLTVLLSPANLLILDEPTNHLDMTSKRVLLDALTHWDGTLMFVSHDRDFIAEVATRVIELMPQEEDPTVPSRFTDIPGDYAYYLHWRARVADLPQQAGAGTASPNEAESSPARSTTPVGSASDAPAASATTGNDSLGESSGPKHQLLKSRRNQIAKLERQSEQLLAKIDLVESEKRQLELEIATEEVYANADRLRATKRRLDESEEQLEGLSAQWDQLSDELVALKHAQSD